MLPRKFPCDQHRDLWEDGVRVAQADLAHPIRRRSKNGLYGPGTKNRPEGESVEA